MLEDINASKRHRHFHHTVAMQIFSCDISTIWYEYVEGVHSVAFNRTKKRGHVVSVCYVCSGLEVTETILVYHVFQYLMMCIVGFESEITSNYGLTAVFWFSWNFTYIFSFQPQSGSVELHWYFPNLHESCCCIVMDILSCVNVIVKLYYIDVKPIRILKNKSVTSVSLAAAAW